MDSPSHVYFDNNATTALDPAVRDVMLNYLDRAYANPSSPYTFARASALALATAREQVAALLRATTDEITFTSGGTESNNAALYSALRSAPDRRHVIMTRVEHASVLQYGRWLEQNGYRVSYLAVDAEGRLDLDELAEVVRDDTAVVSIMAANNETGVIYPVEEAARIAHAKGALFHSDGVQAAGKIPVDLSSSAINFYSICGHKIHAAKGVGALYIRRDTAFHPFVLGGDQERGRRAGTENVAGIAGFGLAAELAVTHLKDMDTRIRELRDRIEREVLADTPASRVAGAGTRRLPNTTDFLFEGVDSDALIALLDMEGISCSSGSACASGAHEPSHVLRAMGLPVDTWGALRVSLSRFTRERDAEYLVGRLVRCLRDLRARPKPDAARGAPAGFGKQT